MRFILILVLLTFSNNTEKRAHKTLFKFYGEDIVLLKTKINVPNGALYEVAGKTDKVYIGYSPSKFDDFDYMVLLDENPLKDIGNTEKINGVIFKGKFYSISDLENKLNAKKR